MRGGTPRARSRRERIPPLCTSGVNREPFLTVQILSVQSDTTSPESHVQRFLPALRTTKYTGCSGIAIHSENYTFFFLGILVFIDFGEAMMYCIHYEELS